MRGRFRELCQGINVDLGTAAAFRKQWELEASGTSAVGSEPPKVITLYTAQNPGDTVVMTAAVYSLHKTYPGKYLTSVVSPWPEVWAYNPNVTLPVDGAPEIRMHYPAIHESNDRAIHFMQGWCEHLSAALGVPVPLQTNRPRLYFPSSRELPRQEDFWLICAGGKRDFTNKMWGYDNYQEVVDRLRNKVRFIQVGLGNEHIPLRRCENVIGRTTLRGLFDMCRVARGVVCGVSLLMHVAAALEKPAIIIAGGREPVQWNAYPKQQYLHTIGMLPCKSVRGETGEACWRSRVVQLGDNSVFDIDPCERPVNGLPQCMQMIEPKRVAELILGYSDGIVPC